MDWMSLLLVWVPVGIQAIFLVVSILILVSIKRAFAEQTKHLRVAQESPSTIRKSYDERLKAVYEARGMKVE
jgi:putative salt-induced outer membrane protein YdiY